MVTYPSTYYTRFDPNENYEQHVYLAGRVLQSAELNEVQQASQDRLRRIADVFFQDGAVIRDAGIQVDPDTGAATLESGAVYLRGAVRGVAPASFTVPVTGTVSVGIYLQDTLVSETDDPTLRDPALGSRNYGEPGAMRLQTTAVWGQAGDGTTGDFWPVYTVQDGIPQSKDPPPQIDAIALAIASYDRQSAGGFYISSGCKVLQLPDDGSGNQVYSLGEGVARVDGREVDILHARRIVYPAVPDLKQVISEPHTALGGTERVNLNHGPVNTVDQVLINSLKEVTVTHGAFSGAVDTLPDSPVLSIQAVNQGGTWNGTTFTGGTTYVAGTDYKLTSDSVDWSLPGSEPAPGSTYQVAYIYLASVQPTAVDDTGFTVAGAVAGSVTQVTYRWKRPRVDRLCLDTTGTVIWVAGVPNDTAPISPGVPPGLLSIASVLQTWTTGRVVTNDGTRVVAMAQLESMQTQIDNLFNAVSDQQLLTQTAINDPTTKVGIFTDAFNDDSKRDAGIGQTAAVYAGILTLPMVGVTVVPATLPDVQTLPLNTAGTVPVLQQTLRTYCQLVNPYMSYDPLPGSCTIAPATDFWTDTSTTWAGPLTQRFTEAQTVTTAYGGWEWWAPLRLISQQTQVLVSDSTQVVGQTTTAAEYLRQISVAFTLTQFGPGEVLNSVTFDGIPVAFTA